MYIGPQVKYSLFLSDFNETYFLDRFSKNIQILNFMKIRPLGAELFHAERQTDKTKLLVFFAILRTRIKITNVYSFSFYLCR